MRCASNLACGASYAASLHTLAEEYCGVPEPSLTLCERVSRGWTSFDLGKSLDTRPRFSLSVKSHAKLVYKSP